MSWGVSYPYSDQGKSIVGCLEEHRIYIRRYKVEDAYLVYSVNCHINQIVSKIIPHYHSPSPETTRKAYGFSRQYKGIHSQDFLHISLTVE